MKKVKITKQQVVEILKKRWWVILIEIAVLAFILVADQLSKMRAVKLVEEQGTHEIIKGLITLTYSENRGGGFGVFQGNTVAFSVVTLVIMAAIFVYLVVAQKQTMWLRLPLIFLVGGGIGNVIDRLKLGYVRDFVQFSFWPDFPVFNVADNFVTIGAFWLIIVLTVMLVQEGRKNQKEFESQKKPVEEGADPLDAPINLNPMLESKNDFDFEEPKEQNDETKTDEESGEEKGEDV